MPRTMGWVCRYKYRVGTSRKGVGGGGWSPKPHMLLIPCGIILAPLLLPSDLPRTGSSTGGHGSRGRGAQGEQGQGRMTRRRRRRRGAGAGLGPGRRSKCLLYGFRMCTAHTSDGNACSPPWRCHPSRTYPGGVVGGMHATAAHYAKRLDPAPRAMPVPLPGMFVHPVPPTQPPTTHTSWRSSSKQAELQRRRAAIDRGFAGIAAAARQQQQGSGGADGVGDGADGIGGVRPATAEDIRRVVAAVNDYEMLMVRVRGVGGGGAGWEGLGGGASGAWDVW